MNHTRDLVKANRHNGHTHPRLPFMNIDEVLSGLNALLDCRRNDDLPTLVVLEGSPFVGKSSLSECMSEDGSSICKLDSKNLLGYSDELATNTHPAFQLNTKIFLIDDADRCDQMGLLNLVLRLLDLEAKVILFVRSTQRMAAVLLGNSAIAKMTPFGLRELAQKSSLQLVRE